MGLRKIKLCIVAALLLVFSIGYEVFGVELIKFNEDFKGGTYRIEMRDLGYEFTNLIPADESAITSLAEGTDGNIYGGTTGYVCHLFVFSKSSNDVKHLGKISGHESIHHSIVAADDGTIYFGTGLNEFDQIPMSKPIPGHAGIVKSLWADIKNRYSGYDGGRLYKFEPSKEKRTWIKPDDECIAEDLGVAVPNNSIYAMTINNERKEIYGLTYPYGHFFVYEIGNKKFIDMGQIYEKKTYAGPDNRTLRTISRALVCDDKGFVYGSADDGLIFRYDPEKKKVEKLDVKFPIVYLSAIEAFAKDNKGTIYGGTLEGYLFRFEPEKLKVTNLGKPLAQLRIRALSVGKDSVVYGVAGERENHCQVFSYNPAEGGFDILGLLKVVREPYYRWTGLQFDAMVTGSNGVIYFGESERRSHLFLFYP